MLETMPAHIPEIMSIQTCENLMVSLWLADVKEVVVAGSAKATVDYNEGPNPPPPGVYING